MIANLPISEHNSHEISTIELSGISGLASNQADLIDTLVDLYAAWLAIFCGVLLRFGLSFS
jgi:hypothetical protein